MMFVNSMIGAFCCAVGTRFVHHIRKKSFANYCERFTLITFAIGFIIGLIWQSYLGNTWTTILCCTGAYLTYVTLVFTWSAKPSVQNMEVIEHD